MRRQHLLGGLVMASLGSLAMPESVAHACGGCFTPPPPPSESESVITDEKMLLSISMSQTTLYDQISYSGNPASFAWVLPIKGQVTVGLSADVMFQVVSSLTGTVVEQPPTNCPPAPACAAADGYTEDSAASSDDEGSSAGPAGVTVTSQAQVGPYETVQLHSTDGSALTNWLTSHGYQIPDSTKPIIDAYVTGGFDFLALKLVPGEGVQSMQPVRVTSQGAAPSLPLHMVAVGTGPTTGITIWVVAEGRWEPSNFPTFTIPDSQIAWDWATSSSNYETLRLAKEAALGGRGWQIESSLELSQYSIQEAVQSNAEYATVGGYLSAPPSVDGGVPDAAPSDGAVDEDAGLDDPGADDGGASANAANEDLAVLFAGIAGPNVRVTRMRSDVAKAALSVDMSLAASPDQSEISNVHTPQIEIGEPICPVYDDSCSQVGTLPLSQIGAQGVQTSNAGASGCATIPRRDGSRGTFGALFALAGVIVFRLRQKRRR